MRLYIIRHADPEYENNTITEKGHREAEALACRLQREKITKIFSSSMQRALDTAIYTSMLTGIKIEKYTKKGIRVIVIAKGDNLDNLTYLGFVTLKDELRKEAKEGISLIRNAGINVIMMTGDAKDTAKNIAIDSGIPVSIISQSFAFLIASIVTNFFINASFLFSPNPFTPSRYEEKNPFAF